MLSSFISTLFFSLALTGPLTEPAAPISIPATSQTLTLHSAANQQIWIDGRTVSDTTIVLENAFVVTDADADRFEVSSDDTGIHYSGDVALTVMHADGTTQIIRVRQGGATLSVVE
jgi:hypothetical protein